MDRQNQPGRRQKRVLLLTTPTSYRTQDFVDAAARLGIEPVVAVDTPKALADAWDFRLGVDFSQPDAAVDALQQALANTPVDAVLALDDSGARVAALLAARLGLAHNDPTAAEAARNKFHMRQLLAEAGAPVPRFVRLRTDQPPAQIVAQSEAQIGYPCVVKPEELNGSRGVIRADSSQELAAAVGRLTALIGPARWFLVEGYIPGVEVALEGLMDGDRLHVLALFDKPDPLEGPFFEETLYVTPSRLGAETQQQIAAAAQRAARGLGLRTGPVHAELRLNRDGPWIVEVAGRSIGGLCSRILRFGMEVGGSSSLEELILRQACGLPLESLERESRAGGVMMIPIPQAGILRCVEGVEAARAVTGVEDVQITARINHSLVPLPEGDAYLGFIFARGETPAGAEAALRQAHSRLRFEIAPEFVLASGA